MSSLTGGVAVVEDLPPGPPSALPGASINATLAIRSGQSEANAEIQSFAVTCVELADGSAEGIPEHVMTLRQMHTGNALQLRRLLPMIEHIQQYSDEDWISAVRTAISSIAEMGLTLADGTAAQGSLASGMRNGNLSVTMSLSGAQDLAARAGIPAGRGHLANLILRYRATSDYLERIKTN